MHLSPGYLLRPSSLVFLKPPLQPPQQDSVGGLHLSVRLGVFDRCEHLLDAYLCTQFSQLLACKLSIFRDKAPRYTEAIHNVLPDKVLYLVCGDLRHRLYFYPLCEVLNSNYQVLHLPYC